MVFKALKVNQDLTGDLKGGHALGDSFTSSWDKLKNQLPEFLKNRSLFGRVLGNHLSCRLADLCHVLSL